RETPAHDHVHGHRARSWSFPPDVVFARARLADRLDRIASGSDLAPVARLKGLFRTDEGTFLIEIAGGRVHERPSGARRESRLDVLVADGDEAAFAKIEAALAAARQTPEEQAAQSDRLEVVLPDGRRAVFGREALAALPR